MSNTITITNRGDSSQSIGETNKLIARIAVLEDRLTKLTDKSSKQADMMGKGYASAEAKVKHFEKALKDASNVRMKFAAIEGLQAASQEFKIAKKDFERSMQMSHAQSTGIDAQIQATKLLRAERDNDWNAVSAQLHAEKSLRDDIIARSNAQYATQQQLNREMAVASQVTANMARDNRANAAALQAFDAKQLRQSMEANGRVHQRDMTGRLSAWQSQSLPSSMAASMSAAATEDKLRRAQANREKQDIVGRLTAYQQQPKQLTMTGAMGMAALEDQKQREQSKIAQRKQSMLDRDAEVAQRRQEIEMRVARARELDTKYALRASDERSYANSRPGVEIFNSESTIKARRALLLERKNNLPSEGDDFQKTITELREIDKLLKRINAKPMKAVELGSPKALRQQIKYLEAEMAKIGAGPQWDKLNAKLASAKTQLGGMQQKSRDAEKALSQAATAPMGSWVRLEYELEQAKKELSQLTYGTKEFLAQQAKVAGLQKDWDKLNAAVNKTNKSQQASGGTFSVIAQQAAALATGLGGVYAAMQMISGEYHRWKEFELSMADKGVELEAQIVKQAANIDAADRPEARRWAIAEAGRLLSKPEDTYELLGTAMSSGGETLPRSKKLVESVTPLVLGDKEQALGLAIASGVITSENESDNFKAGAIQVRQFGQRSMGINETQFDENTMKAMAAFMRKNRKVDALSSERALELIAETSHIIKDVDGDKSATSIISELGAFNVFNPKASGKLKSGEKYKIDPQVIKAFNESRNFDERIQMLRDNKMLGKQFIDRMRSGLPQSMAMGMLDTSPKAVAKRKWVEAGIDSFAVAGTKWDAEADSIKKSAGQLYERKRNEATSSATKQKAEYALPAEAWKTYDNLFSKDKINLSGSDTVATTKAFIAMQHDRTVQAQKIKWDLAKQGKTVPEGDVKVNEARAFRVGAETLLNREIASGGLTQNMAVVELLRDAVESLKRQEEQQDALNPKKVNIFEEKRKALANRKMAAVAAKERDVDLTGWDAGRNDSAWVTDRRAFGSEARDSEVQSLEREIRIAKYQRKQEEVNMNPQAIKGLDDSIKVFTAILDELKALNTQVAAGRQGHHAVPRNVAPARVPPVPRVPIAAGSLKSGDPFGMRKR